MSRFLQTYNVAGRAATGHAPAAPEGLLVAGFTEFIDAHHGCEFNSGIYRIHDSESVTVFDSVWKMHPNRSGSLVPFGFDWLGRQFALDLASKANEKEPEVVMIEPGTGEILEIPCTFQEFHEVELVNYPDAALASEFFQEWVTASGRGVDWGRCAGYKVPLFLGGDDVAENLEDSDIDVYWSICAQLLSGIK